MQLEPVCGLPGRAAVAGGGRTQEAEQRDALKPPAAFQVMSSTRESSTDAADRYTFGYTTELSSNHESSLCTAKRLRQRLQRQQSGQSGGLL